MWAYLEAGKGKVSIEYVEYQIMKQMGWTYDELYHAPASVVFDIIRFMNTEAKHVAQGAK